MSLILHLTAFTGATGLIAQVVLLRELMGSFHGHELSIGLILANWLWLEAAGAALAGRRPLRPERVPHAFLGCLSVFAVVFPPAVLSAQLLPVLVRAPPGSGIGLGPMLVGSGLVLAPVSLSHGALFTLACRWRAHTGGSDGLEEPVIGRVYVWETFGTAVGGALLTGLFLLRAPAWPIALVTAVSHLLVALLLLALPGGVPRAGKGSASGLVLLLVLAGLLLAFSAKLQNAARLARWAGRHVVFDVPSRYGKVTVIEDEGQYTFFFNGQPVLTTPDPDRLYVEEGALLPLLAHPAPRRGLALGAGAGGLLAAALSHPGLERVDYVELDPLLLEAVARFPTPVTERELWDPRVRVHAADGRLFVAQTTSRYDVIWLGVPEPDDLQTGRLNTVEFLQLLKRSLNVGGLVGFVLEGAEGHMPPAMLDLHACLRASLRSVFAYTLVLPGDRTVVLASDETAVDALTPDLLADRLEQRGLTPSALSRPHLHYRFRPELRAWYEDLLHGRAVALHRDFQPVGVYYSLALWHARFAPRAGRFLAAAGRRLPAGVAGGIGLLIALGIWGQVGRRDPMRSPVYLAVVTTGFLGMMFDLVLLFAFQVLCGVVYTQIGVLVSAYMVGSVLGGRLMIRMLPGLRRPFRGLLGMETVLLLYLLLLLGAGRIVAETPVSPRMQELARLVLPVLSLVSGILVGAEFPLAGELWQAPRRVGLGPAAGHLYAGDLAGGCLGGLLGSVLLLPILGLAGTLQWSVVLKAALLGLLLFAGRRLTRRPSHGPTGR